MALGLATGVLSGLFGVGGGVISQPGMRALGIEPLVAIGTALPTIIPSAASGTARYARERLVAWRAVRWTVPLGTVAAVGGALLGEVVPGDGHLLQLVTAGLLGFSAQRMLRQGDAAPASPAPERAGGAPAEDAVLAGGAADDEDGAGDHADDGADDGAGDDAGPAAVEEWQPSAARLAGIGVLAGSLSGLLGIGGGVIMVPAFTQLAGMRVKAAIATSLVCVGAFAVPGTITHALLDHIDWRMCLFLVLGVVPGARLGAALAIRATDRRLRLVVSAFLVVTAVVYAAGEVRALVNR